MADYSTDINTDLYKYRQPVYLLEPTGARQTFVPIKLNLNVNNFNFDLARSDGLDFRLAEKSNGTGILQMWVAYWDSSKRIATLWFKLPELLASETRTLYAFWGFEGDSGISDLDNLTTSQDRVYSDSLCTNAGGTASVYSSTGYFSGTPPADYFFDGSNSTYGWFNASAGNTWIQYDFGAGNEKQIEMVRFRQYDIQNFTVQGSNNGIDYFSLYANTLADQPGGVVPDIIRWTGYYPFTNDTAYRYIRLFINTSWGNFLISEIEMMEVTGTSENSDGIFFFADDFDGSSIDVNKWPTTNGSWTIGDSKISLATNAWINSPEILGDSTTTYIGVPARVTPTNGLWGNHQTTGNCYLSYQGYLAYTQVELIDGDYTSYNQYSWLGSPANQANGCGIGIDLGVVVNKISKIRAYIYDVTEADLSTLDWPSDSMFITLYKSNTNVTGDQTHLATFSRVEVPLVKFTNNVWYYDINFPPTGESTRYFHILGSDYLANSILHYRYSQVEVYTQETFSNFLPSNFIVEEGIIGIGNPSSTTTAAHRYRFFGGENVFGINYYWEGSTDRTHDAKDVGSYVTYNGINRGLIIGSYSQNYLGYYEATDHIYQGMGNRGGDATPVYSDNLCTAGALYAESSTSFSTYGADKAFDDNESTYWVGLDGPLGTTSWVGYEFVVPQKITRVLTLWGNGNTYNIEGSNGSETSWDSKSWTILSTGTILGDFTWTEDAFNNPTHYRYVRVKVTSHSGGSPYIYEIKMFRTDSLSGEFDYDDSWERQVHRNTTLTNFRIYGESGSAGNGVDIDWVIARAFTPESDPLIDTSDLWVDYEYVSHQPLDYAVEYASDVTDIVFYHSSDMGGDPYRMSDNVTNSLLNVFISNGTTTLGSIAIDFGRTVNNVVDVDYIHFNSESVYFYNASKLSDLDTDVHDRSYWQTTTTPCWAAIQFPDTKDISCLSLYAVPGNLDKMARDFKFYGSQSDPRFSGWEDKVLIYEGTALPTEGEQVFYFSTGLTFYKYYILEVVTAHADYEIEKTNVPSMVHTTSWGGGWGGNNAPENLSDGLANTYIQRTNYPGNHWVSIDLGSSTEIYKVLLEGLFAASDRFVKNFRVEASHNNLDWDVIYTNITVQNSYPQEFTFDAVSAAYRYWRLFMIDNWGDIYITVTRFELYRLAYSGAAIQEWGMYERDSRLGKKSISQLRLHPVAFTGNEYYFVKEIEFYGSNDGFNWDKLIPKIDTPTPFTDYVYGRWSRYSFENFEAYYIYKLICYDNWRAPDDTIKIAEWEMLERADEIDNVRILSGSTNNINNIWADPTSAIDNGIAYFTNDEFNAVESDKLVDHYLIESPIVEGGTTLLLSDDLTVGGIATAYASPFDGSPTLDAPSAFDGDLGTQWHTTEIYSNTWPVWIQYQFREPQNIIHVRMYPRYNYTSRMPGDFIIKGSNLGLFTGEEVDIFSITGATYTSSQWTVFEFTNTLSYLYYRFHITAKAVGSGTGNYMNIMEIEMKGYVEDLIDTSVVVDDFNVKL